MSSRSLLWLWIRYLCELQKLGRKRLWPWFGFVRISNCMLHILQEVGAEPRVFIYGPLHIIWLQVYRLHQLNRAAQLVAGLLFSLKGVEATPETMAINGSLQSLLSVVQLLGILCLWSLGSYLMHHFPSWPQQNQAISTAESQWWCHVTCWWLICLDHFKS